MKKYTYTDKKDTRSGFGDALTELGKQNENIVAITADVIGSVKMNEFAKLFPERFFDIGIQEANMIGMAAGYTLDG
jgi:transketolase